MGLHPKPLTLNIFEGNLEGEDLPGGPVLHDANKAKLPRPNDSPRQQVREIDLGKFDQ